MTRERIKEIILTETGATAAGIAAVAPVDAAARKLYSRWIEDGCHGKMSYLERYGEVRDDPGKLLDDAGSVIMAAFSFANPEGVRMMENEGRPLVAEYALGNDYHDVIRARLKLAARRLEEECGGRTRVCVDTAPLRERYWAREAGLGFIGVNNYLILPGLGAHFCLGALLWTERPDDGFDSACVQNCCGCGRCVTSCPGGALGPDGRLDARRCLSYLTIEDKGSLPVDTNAGRRLFGCDVCRRVCPHEPVEYDGTSVDELRARPEVVALTERDWREMDETRFSELFARSAVRRAGLSKIKDTLSHLTPPDL